jgi:hypothetical protein
MVSHRDIAHVRLVWGIGEQISASDTVEDLEVVTVEMERVRLEIVVVDGELDDGVEREDYGVGIGSVDSWVSDNARVSSTESVQGRDLEGSVMPGLPRGRTNLGSYIRNSTEKSSELTGIVWTESGRYFQSVHLLVRKRTCRILPTHEISAAP